MGSQRVLARLMALDREDQIPRTRNVSVSWVVLMFGFGLLLGLVAVPALAERGLLNQVLLDPERVYLITSTSFFHPLVAGFLLTAVVAAVMSTADSQLLLASAVATDDIPFFNRLAYAVRTRSPRLDGPHHASGSRADLRRPLHISPGLRIHPGLLGLGRHGSSLRSGNPPRPVLAALQLLGGSDLHLGGHGRCHLLVVSAPGCRLDGPNPGPLRPVGGDEDRPRRRLEYPARHTRLPDCHPGGGLGNPASHPPRPGRQ